MSSLACRLGSLTACVWLACLGKKKAVDLCCVVAAAFCANNMQFSHALRISCVATVVACCFVGMLFVAIQCEYCCCAVVPQQQWGGVYTPSSNLPSQCSAASADTSSSCTDRFLLSEQ